MKLNYKFVVLVSTLFVALAACASSDDLIATEHEALKHPPSTLVYTHTNTTSSATGKCAGRATKWWHGAEEEPDTLINTFEEQLSKNGWVIWPEDVTQVWRKENNDGLFSFSLHVFTNTEKIAQNAAYYYLPDSVLLEMADYRTAYVVTMSHMFPAAASRCLKR